MSKVSDALKETERFSRALRNVAVKGNVEDLRIGLRIAASYVEMTATLIKDVAKNPFKLAATLAFGGRYDPYKELRPMADAFVATWLHPDK